MPDSNTVPDLGTRLSNVRKMRGLSRDELARLSGVSKSLIAKLEQGVVADTRVETARKLAVALRVTTSALLGGYGDAEPPAANATDPALWEPTRKALLNQLGQPDEEPTIDGVERGLESIKPMLADNHYSDIAAILPGLLRDADAVNGAGRAVRSRVLNCAGWILTQTRQFDVAEPTLHQAIDAADDRLDAAAAVNTLVWLYLRQGMLDQARTVATRWADDIEPRFSRASVRELTLWGRLLLGITNAAVRDNRPGEAEDAIKLARAAAVRIGREVMSDSSTTRTFGPVTVSMIKAENEAITGHPDKVLAIAERIPTTVLHARSASRNRHRLEVANALDLLRRRPEAMGILVELADASPEWLRTQRYARDIYTRMVNKRRTLPPEMLRVGELIGVSY
jgi:transcriptional regulator with XRE-family HTH domain